MIIINRKHKIEQYKVSSMPKFSHRRTAIKWEYNEQLNAELINIKSIDIQVKDIRQMKYSSTPLLVSLFAQLDLAGEYSDEDYINISKYKKGNKALIFAILNTDWLLRLEDLENKTEDELEYEILCLQNNLNATKKKENSNNAYNIENHIKLLEYKLSCLETYMYQRMERQQDSQMLKRKIPNLWQQYYSINKRFLKAMRKYFLGDRDE